MGKALPYSEQLMRQARLAQGLPATGPVPWRPVPKSPPKPTVALPPINDPRRQLWSAIGKKFGALTVIGPDKDYMWRVSCEACGGISSFSLGRLKTRKNPTCGCIPVRIFREKSDPKIGLTFGHLTIVGRDARQSRWLASCDACGRVKSYLYSSLPHRQNPTCGCVPPDRVGRTIGHLTILAYDFGFYQCACAVCGEITPFMWPDLDKRKNPTCGCRPLPQRRRRPEPLPCPPSPVRVPHDVEPEALRQLCVDRPTEYRFPELLTNGRLGDGNRMVPKGIREEWNSWEPD